MDAHSPTSTPSPPPQAYYPLSKRDKRRHNFTDRIQQLSQDFITHRDLLYRNTLQELQTKLSSLHNSTDLVFIERVTDLEELRDADLVSLYLNQQFLLSRAEKEYERDVQVAEEEYETLAKSIRDRLLARLEAQRKKLQEDKEMLDIANDHSLVLSVAGYTLNGGGSTNSVPGSPGGGSERRKNLRRRGEATSSAMLGAISELAGAKKRKRYGRGDKDDVAAFWSDRDGFGFRDESDRAGERDRTTTSGRHRDKAFTGMSVLKNEEANEDLALIRKKRKRK
ncbi:Sds3-like protein [Dipodascopsis tothii]|uniref:Sds3-like protein n=1 Tax=Dipodascopsis tothii TaxID=44089 RepID=UPI0034CEE8C5